MSRMAGISVRQCMTPSPVSITVDQTIADAGEVMRKHAIRHLPVLKGGKIVGMLTERDLRLIEILEDLDPKMIVAADAMGDVYAIPPETPLATVVAHMERERLDAAVIVDGEQVVGVFTTTDACRALRERLE